MIENPASDAVNLTDGGSDDLDDVVQVMEAAFDDAYGEAWTRSQCAGILPMPGVALLVARDGAKRPLGFSLSRTIVDDAELLLIAVAPAERGRGVGRMLLESFMESARSKGARRVHLEVRDGNPAVSMYKAAGFSAAGRRRKYYRGRDGREFDALTFNRALNI